MTKKRALVTGGSGAIGAVICQRLAADGYAVIVHAHRHAQSAEQVAEKIAANGGTASVTTFDVVDGVATAEALRDLLNAGPIQVVVNNAGLHDDAPMAGMTDGQWKHVIDVSLHGFFHVTQPLLLPDDRNQMGANRLHFLAGRGHRQSRSNELCGREGRPAWGEQIARARAGIPRRDGERRRARLDRISGCEQAFTPAQVESLVPMKRVGNARGSGRARGVSGLGTGGIHYGAGHQY